MENIQGILEVKPPPRFYYGWRIVIASIIGLTFGASATVFFTFGVFVSPLEVEFGWSRVDISLAFTIATCATVAISPLIGILVDKFGVCKTLLPSIVLLALAIGSVALITGSIWYFYFIYLVIPIAGSATLPVSYSRLLVTWFDKKRGLALGIGLSGVGLGAAILPPFIQTIISSIGWREAYLGLAAVILFISLPVVAIILREKPEDLGLLPDGMLPRSGVVQQLKRKVFGYEFSEIFGLKAFWLMALAFLLMGIMITGIIVHLVPLLISNEMGPQDAAYMASVLGVTLIVGRAGAGFLMDRFFAPYVAIAFLLGPVVGLSLFALSVEGVWIIVSTSLIGLAIGAEFDVIAYLTSRYFGIKSFGRVYGVFYAIFTVGSGIGPLLMAFGYESFNHYTEVLWGFVGITLIACYLIKLLGPYPNLKPKI